MASGTYFGVRAGARGHAPSAGHLAPRWSPIDRDRLLKETLSRYDLFTGTILMRHTYNEYTAITEPARHDARG